MGWEARNGQQINRQPFAISQESAEILKKRGGVSIVLHTRFFRETPQEFISALESQGVPVTVHKLEGKLSDEKNVTMFNSLQSPEIPSTILVLSELVAPFWSNGELPGKLQELGTTKNVAIMPLFPRRAWDRTILGQSLQGFVERKSRKNNEDGITNNTQLKFTRQYDYMYDEPTPKNTPIPTIMEDGFDEYVKLLGTGKGHNSGVLFQPDEMAKEYVYHGEESKIQPSPTVENKIEDIFSHFPPKKREFIAAMAALPITQSSVEAIRKEMFPEITESDFVEMLYSGFLEQLPGHEDDLTFDFFPGLREKILMGVPMSTARQIISVANTSFMMKDPAHTAEYNELTYGDLKNFTISEQTDANVLEFAKVILLARRGMDGWARKKIIDLLNQIDALPGEKQTALEKPIKQIDTKVIEQDHGFSLLQTMLAIDPLSVHTFEDLKQFDGFEETFRQMSLFFTDHLSPNGIVEEREFHDIFRTNPTYVLGMSWTKEKQTYRLIFEYPDEALRTKKIDPYSVRLEIADTALEGKVKYPLLSYDMTYHFIDGKREGTASGGVSNGKDLRGFLVERGYSNTISVKTSDNNKDVKQVSQQIAVIMQQTAKILLDRYTEVTGQKQIDSLTITEI